MAHSHFKQKSYDEGSFNILYGSIKNMIDCWQFNNMHAIFGKYLIFNPIYGNIPTLFHQYNRAVSSAHWSCSRQFFFSYSLLYFDLFPVCISMAWKNTQHFRKKKQTIKLQDIQLTRAKKKKAIKKNVRIIFVRMDNTEALFFKSHYTWLP